MASTVENYARKIEHSLKLTANKLPKTLLVRLTQPAALLYLSHDLCRNGKILRAHSQIEAFHLFPLIRLLDIYDSPFHIICVISTQ